MQVKRYNDYTQCLKAQFAERVQKISINAGFTCPNRDGTKGVGGCTYCNNLSFLPEYCSATKSVTEQMQEGITFFHHKYQSQRYIAYFQSYTNTYGSVERVVSLYEEALSLPNVVGIAVGTRPDCMPQELLDYFAEVARSRYVMIEYGVESTLNRTLELINRGHSYEDAVDTICATAQRGVAVAAHLILGLPMESRGDMLQHARTLSQLPLTALKLHQLQIVRGTRMAEQFVEHPEWFTLFTADEYIDLVVDFLEQLSPHIAIERFISQSPKALLLAPDWGVKNFEFVARVDRRLRERNTYQGRLWRE